MPETTRRGFLGAVGAGALTVLTPFGWARHSSSSCCKTRRIENQEAEPAQPRLPRPTRRVKVQPGQKIQDVLDSLAHDDRVIIGVPSRVFPDDSLVITRGESVKLVGLFDDPIPGHARIELTRPIEVRGGGFVYMSNLHFVVTEPFDSAVLDAKNIDPGSHLIFNGNIVKLGQDLCTGALRYGGPNPGSHVPFSANIVG